MKDISERLCAPEITHRLTMVVNRTNLNREADKFALMRERLLAMGVGLTLIASDGAAK